MALRDTTVGSTPIEKVNRDVAEYEAKQKRAEEQRTEQERQHRGAATEAAKRIHFD